MSAILENRPDAYAPANPSVLILGPDLSRASHGGVVTFVKEVLNSGLDTSFELESDWIEWRGRGLQRFVNLIRDAGRIGKHVSSSCPDLVHASISITRLSLLKLAYYLWMRRRHGFRLLLHIHGGTVDSYPAVAGLFSRLMARCDRVVFLTSGQRESVQRRLKGQMAHFVLLPNYAAGPVDAPSREAANVGPPVLLFLSRAVRTKGLLDFVEAVALLPEEVRAQAKFVVAGDGPDLARAQDLVTKYGLAPNVAFVGYVLGETKQHVLRTSDVYILPSYAEAFPFSILEAMSFGHAVIATPVGAVPELVRHDMNGFIVPVGDVAGLAQKMAELITSDDLCRKMQRRSRELFLENYDMQGPGRDALETLYREVLDS